jgi:hypothetical protein
MQRTSRRLMIVECAEVYVGRFVVQAEVEWWISMVPTWQIGRRGRVCTAMALHATSNRRDRVWTGGLVLCE